MRFLRYFSVIFLSIVFFVLCSKITSPQDTSQSNQEQQTAVQSLAKTTRSSDYIYILRRTRVPTKDKGYTYEVEIAVDCTKHPIPACPGLSGKKHLNIKVWRKGSRDSSWKQINDLHALVSKCTAVVYDSRAGIPCTSMEYCTKTIYAVGTCLGVYVVKNFVQQALIENWPTIVRAIPAIL